MNKTIQWSDGQNLYVHKDTSLESICAHLHEDEVKQIVIQGKDERVIGFVPLCQILRLLCNDSNYLDALITKLSILEIMKAIGGTLLYQPKKEVHFEHFALLPSIDQPLLHHSLVICEGNRQALACMLRTHASCVIAASREVISISLVQEAKEQGITFIQTSLPAIEAAQAIWKRMPVRMLMKRFSLHG